MSAESDDGTLRSGFQLSTTFSEHRSAIRYCVYNSKCKTFLSVDDRCARLWKITGQEIVTISFPSGNLCFLTHILYIAEHNIYLAVALDRTLKVYDEKMQLVNSLPWGKDDGLVSEIVYSPTLDELITSGTGGVKVWSVAMDGARRPPDLTENKGEYEFNNPLMAQTIWKRKSRVTMVKRLDLVLPFATDQKHHGDDSWVNPPYFNDQLQLLFVFWGSNVYVYHIGHHNPYTNTTTTSFNDHFSFEYLEPMWTWTMLHDQSITAVNMLVVPSHTRGGNLFITGARDSKIKVWRQKQSQYQIAYVRSIGTHTKSVSSIQLHIPSNSLISAAMDGSVQMWSLESFEPMHRAKLSSAVLSLHIADSKMFYIFTATEVKLFYVVHLHDTFAQYNSTVTKLVNADKDRFLVVCEDSSARLVDAMSGESISTIVPQLSTNALTQIVYSKPTGRVYALLSHGEIHVYSTKTNPSTRKELWTQTRKERVSCMAMCYAKNLGLEEAGKSGGGGGYGENTPLNLIGEILVVGTGDGDVWFVETRKGDFLLHRIQSHRNIAIKAIQVVEEHKTLVTLGDPKRTSAVKLWRLAPEGISHQHTINFSEVVTQLDVVGEFLLLGHAHGSIRMVNVLDGRHIPVPQAGDHSQAVADIHASVALKHFLTCSSDGCIMVFDSKKRLEQALALESPVACVNYLNDKGDIIAGFGDRLIVISASLYINHRRMRDKLAGLRDVLSPILGEDEDRAVPTEAILKARLESEPAGGVYSDEESESEESDDNDDARSCQDVELTTDNLWAPRKPRDADAPRVPKTNWKEEEEDIEKLYEQIQSGNIVPLLNLPGKSDEKKKRRKKKKKKNKATVNNELTIERNLQRRGDTHILFGLQEYKALASVTATIGFLPNATRHKKH